MRSRHRIRFKARLRRSGMRKSLAELVPPRPPSRASPGRRGSAFARPPLRRTELVAGTEGSNPFPSSGESGANLTFSLNRSRDRVRLPGET